MIAPNLIKINDAVKFSSEQSNGNMTAISSYIFSGLTVMVGRQQVPDLVGVSAKLDRGYSNGESGAALVSLLRDPSEEPGNRTWYRPHRR